MDERTKSILVIEQKMADEAGQINRLLRGLGQLLLEHSDSEDLAVERADYGKIVDETARLDEAIRQVEKDGERVSGIDGKIAEEERQKSALKERLTAIYPKMGKLAVEDPAFSAFAAPYKTRIAAIQQKIEGLSGRLNGPNETEEKGNVNVFVWLGKGAQHLVVKSFLARTQSSLERVYAEAGAEFTRNRPASQAGSGETEALYASVESLKNENNGRDLRIIALKEEKRTILSSFGREGSANRKKAEIARRKDRLYLERDDLYLRLGKKAEGPLFMRLTLQPPFDGEINKIRETVAHCREQVKDYENQIAGLKASLEIDRERAEVEKLERSVAEQRQRIALAGEAIVRYEKAIAEAHKRIEDLMNGPGKWSGKPDRSSP
jgi:predicted RNase H-like nuclease (RuvC/YqgF family)